MSFQQNNFYRWCLQVNQGQIQAQTLALVVWSRAKLINQSHIQSSRDNYIWTLNLSPPPPPIFLMSKDFLINDRFSFRRHQGNIRCIPSMENWFSWLSWVSDSRNIRRLFSVLFLSYFLQGKASKRKNKGKFWLLA